MQLPDDLDLIAELDEPTPEQEAIAAVLPDLDALIGTHAGHCDSEPCPARQTLTRIRRTLTEGTTDMPEIDRDRFRRLAEHAAHEATTVDDPAERADAAAFAGVFSAAAAVRDVPHAETRPLLEAVDRLAKIIEESIDA